MQITRTPKQLSATFPVFSARQTTRHYPLRRLRRLPLTHSGIDMATYAIQNIVNNPTGPGILVTVAVTRVGANAAEVHGHVVTKEMVIPDAGAIDTLAFVTRVARAVHSGQLTVAQAKSLTETF